VSIDTDNRPEEERDGSRGFSAFKFLPGKAVRWLSSQFPLPAIYHSDTNDELIVALKTVEVDGVPLATYITFFHTDGRVIRRDRKITCDCKLEGIEFINWNSSYWGH